MKGGRLLNDLPNVLTPKQLAEMEAPIRPGITLPWSLEELAEQYHERVDWPGSAYPLPAWLTSGEQGALLWEASRRDAPHGHIIEIGAGWAASSFILTRGNEWRAKNSDRKGEHVFLFDPWGGKLDLHRQSTLYLAITGSEETAHHIRGTSVLLEAGLIPDASVRLAFIDGDHSLEWAQRDLLAVARTMVDGGVVLLHDCNQGGPGTVWREAIEAKAVHAGGVRLVPQAGLFNTIGLFRVERDRAYGKGTPCQIESETPFVLSS